MSKLLMRALGMKFGENVSRFAQCGRGNLAVITALTVIPMMLAVGLSVDYTSASNERGAMQNALDAAVLAAVQEGTEAAALKKLKDVYTGNLGQGTPSITSYSVDSDGVLSIAATAGYNKQNSFMQIAGIYSTEISVGAAASAKMSLTKIKFTLEYVKGYYDKTVTLYGRRVDEPAYGALAEIKYVWNGIEGDDGAGTTTLNRIEGGNRTETARQVCNGNNPNSCGELTGSEKDGTNVDVSEMADLYLEMKTSAQPKAKALWEGMRNADYPTTIKTNEKDWSYFLFIDGDQMKKNEVVDFFSIIPCGKPSKQAWEDGGSPYLEGKNKFDVTDTDFRYLVEGKCELGKGTRGPVLTQ